MQATHSALVLVADTGLTPNTTATFQHLSDANPQVWTLIGDLTRAPKLHASTTTHDMSAMLLNTCTMTAALVTMGADKRHHCLIVMTSAQIAGMRWRLPAAYVFGNVSACRCIMHAARSVEPTPTFCCPAGMLMTCKQTVRLLFLLQLKL